LNAPLPVDETRRLQALHACLVLDTAPDAVFDDVTALLSHLLQVPISLVSLVDESRQWFKSHHGLGVTSTPREYAFCAHAILRPNEIFEVPDARLDPRFSDNPLVTGEPHIRFYAGVPLVSADGHALGTLNVIDHRPRQLDDAQKFLLRTLGRQVSAQLELRKALHSITGLAEERRASEARLRAEYEVMLAQERSVREQLRASELRFRTLADLSTVGIGGSDDTGAVVYVNDRAAEIVGVPRDECLGDGWGRHLHPGDAARVQQAWSDALAHRRPYRDEFRFLHPDGRVVHVLGEAKPLPMAQPGEISYVTTVIDVTAVKELEQHRLAREAAEKANKAKSSFLARMSHELRTPLNGILGFAQLLQLGEGGVQDARQLRFVRHIEHAGQHLLELIGEILDLARIEAGVVPLTIEPTPVASALEQAIALVHQQAASTDVQVVMDLGLESQASVLADTVRLQEVLLNLLSNAVKYNRQGGTVRLRVRSADATVMIEVEDTGIGLDSAQLQRMFEPFNRLGAESTAVQGTGLGLAIAKNLVELMGGTLTVRSQAGTGSTFTLALPQAAESVSQA